MLRVRKAPAFVKDRFVGVIDKPLADGTACKCDQCDEADGNTRSVLHIGRPLRPCLTGIQTHKAITISLSDKDQGECDQFGMKPLLLIASLALGALPLAAQDRAGNDTAGEWRITHHTPYGLWDVMCDARETGDTKEERCYIRHVEVFSPRPNFAAQYLFITPAETAPKIEVGIERRTRFADNGFRIEKSGEEVWSLGDLPCKPAGKCNFEGAVSVGLIEAMLGAGGQSVFAFDFTDRHGVERALRWDLSNFDAIYENFVSEATKRALM